MDRVGNTRRWAIAAVGLAMSGCALEAGEVTEAAETLGETRAALTAPGSISFEKWTGITGTSVSAIPLASAPSSTGTLTTFELPINTANDYGVRVRGSLIPPASGSYTFWIAGDDNVELYLSTGPTAAAKTRIAYHTQWTNSREWNKFLTQKSAPVSLVAGQRYYIEALLKEGTGGDNLAVGWLKPGQTGTVPSEVIPGAQLAPYEAPPATVEYQAESATLFNAVVETLHAGYTGTAYANTNNVVGSYVQWEINAAAAGVATVGIRYANIDSAARHAELRVNGSVVNPDLTFPGTGSWSSWSTVTVTVNLNAGSNTFRLTGIDSVSCPNLDKIDVTMGGTQQDSDGDRLPDSAETNTGLYVSPSNTGTNPLLADTDGDAIADGDEVLGTLAGLNLPAIGTNPLRKNILIEHDWFDDTLECGAHSHRPSATALSQLNQVFASAPVSNPDGTTGITVINDYGQGGAFSGGNLVADSDGVLAQDVFGPEYQGYKTAHLANNRRGYFHYVLHVHRYDTTSGSSGYAEIFGDDFIVSLQCSSGVTEYVRNTIMHELGHNLNLEHGGFEYVNDKPNYNSVMNYRFQFSGIDSNCDASGDGVADYSRGTRISLNESSLNEAAGVCGNVAIDWNFSGSIQSNVSLDLNFDSTLSTLADSNDWARVTFAGLSSAAQGGGLSKRAVACGPVPTP